MTQAEKNRYLKLYELYKLGYFDMIGYLFDENMTKFSICSKHLKCSSTYPLGGNKDILDALEENGGSN